MRNLKKLLAVVVAICVLATFTVPAFAEDSAIYANADQAQKLYDMGLYAGISTTSFVPDLGSKLTREQGMVLLLKLFGKTDAANALTDEEVAAALEGFTDAAKISSWAKKAMAYALKNGITAGTSTTTVGPQGTLTGNQFATFILKEAGFTVADWTKAAEDLAAKGVTGATAVATTQLTRDDLVGIAFGTLTVANAAGKTVIEALVDAGKVTAAAAEAAGVYSAKVTATVAATGAKKLTVTFNKAVDTTKAVIEVKRGTVKPSVKSVTFAADKKSAVVEFTTSMAEGDYTVTVTGLGDAATATVKVAAEKLTVIKFLSELAVISGNNVTTNVKGENQYGEDVTAKLTTANVNVSKGSSASISNKGVLTIVGALNLFNVDDKVVVTVVDSATGVVATKTLTVAKAAAVASIEFGALTTDNKDLKDKEINVTAMTTNAAEYYMPITVKDQYGNVLKASEVLAAVTFYSSNTKIVKLATTAIVDLADDKGTAIKFATADATATSGTAVITAVSVSTGVSANTTVAVKDNAKLDVVTLSAPASELKLTKATELPVTVLDTYGKEVALKDVTFSGAGTGTLTLNTDTKITAVNATFSTSKDYVKDVTTIKITPTDKNIIVTVTTATGKYQSLTLTANNAPVVSGIKGVKSDFVSMLANDTSLTTDLAAKLLFVDQYGEEITAPSRNDGTVAAIHYSVAKEDAASTVTTETGGTITSSTTAGAINYVVTLKDAAEAVLDTYTVGITVVDKDKITAFGIDDLNKFYTVTGSAAHAQTVKIHGLVDGKKVVVNQNMIKGVTADNGLLGVASNGVYTPTNVNTDGKDVAAKITVLVANKDNTYVVTKDVAYSNVAPKATSLVAEYDGTKVEGGAKQIAVAELNKNIVPNTAGAGNSKLQFVAKDQYGVQRIFSDFTVVVTNQGTTGTFNGTGAGSGFVAGDVGKSLNVNVFIDGLYQTLKLIAE